jgi:hypothetical protein
MREKEKNTKEHGGCWMLCGCVGSPLVLQRFSVLLVFLCVFVTVPLVLRVLIIIIPAFVSIALILRILLLRILVDLGSLLPNVVVLKAPLEG